MVHSAGGVKCPQYLRPCGAAAVRTSVWMPHRGRPAADWCQTARSGWMPHRVCLCQRCGLETQPCPTCGQNSLAAGETYVAKAQAAPTRGALCQTAYVSMTGTSANRRERKVAMQRARGSTEQRRLLALRGILVGQENCGSSSPRDITMRIGFSIRPSHRHARRPAHPSPAKP